MEPYLCITQINDFIFCPRSIYFHNIYQQNYSQSTYHKTWQKKGLAAHKSIDTLKYSTSNHILQGLSVYSEKYNLVGKIDTLDTQKHELTERKYSVTQIYDGFRYQLYAQYFALLEMGYQVQSLKIYSKKSNTSYPIEIPTTKQTIQFSATIKKMHQFSLTEPFTQNPKKCIHCIYNQLCDIYTSND